MGLFAPFGGNGNRGRQAIKKISMVLDSLLFDGVIIFFLLAVGAAIGLGIYKIKKNGKIYYYFLVFALAISWLVVFWGSFIEPRIIITKEYEVDISNGEAAIDELKAVVVADFHLGPYNDDTLVKRTVEKINQLDPDIIFIPGDFISFDNDDAKDFYPLADLRAPFGTYAVTGNHDYLVDIEELVSEVEKYNVEFLRNRGKSINIDERSIFLAGVDDYWHGDMDLAGAMENYQDKAAVILLAHNPDVVNFLGDIETDLIISGHTHGGQIRLPLIGSVVQPPTNLPRNIEKGLEEWRENRVFITSGLGEFGPRARLFNLPEISVLNIKY
jgi:hypothetical protein